MAKSATYRGYGDGDTEPRGFLAFDPWAPGESRLVHDTDAALLEERHPGLFDIASPPPADTSTTPATPPPADTGKSKKGADA